MKQNKNQKNTAVNQITEGVIWKQLLIFFFPILFGTLFQQIYNTADTVVVGRWLPVLLWEQQVLSWLSRSFT